MKRSDWLKNTFEEPIVSREAEFKAKLKSRGKIDRNLVDGPIRERSRGEQALDSLSFHTNTNGDVLGYGPQHRRRLREEVEERQRRSTLEERLRTGDLTAEEWRERYANNMMRTDGPFDANNDNTTRPNTSNSTRNSVRHARNRSFF